MIRFIYIYTNNNKSAINTLTNTEITRRYSKKITGFNYCLALTVCESESLFTAFHRSITGRKLNKQSHWLCIWSLKNRIKTKNITFIV